MSINEINKKKIMQIQINAEIIVNKSCLAKNT